MFLLYVWVKRFLNAPRLLYEIYFENLSHDVYVYIFIPVNSTKYSIYQNIRQFNKYLLKSNNNIMVMIYSANVSIMV